MALTRKLLKGMGLTEEQVDTIIDAHTETVDGLKEDLKQAKKDAEEAADLRKQLKTAQDDLKAAQDDGWEEKAKDFEKKYNDLVAENKNKETKAAKESAAKAFFESKGITGNSLEIAMRGSSAEIAALDLDGEKIKDSSALDALVNGTFKALVSTTTTKGADTSNPPASSHSVEDLGSLSMADYIAARQKK